MAHRTRRQQYGQHFLTDPQLAKKIIDLAAVSDEDTVLEIGPGKGILTKPLAEQCQRLIAVEKDRVLSDKLGADSSGHPLDLSRSLNIINDDFLEVDLESLLVGQEHIKVVANLPYSVATEIIFKLIDYRRYFQGFWVMVQKEVAERIVAKSGSKTYGILSIMTQLYCDSKIVLRVKPGSFSPPPKVDSAVLEMKVSQQPRVAVKDTDLLKKIVRQAFATRRKMIKNNLADICTESDLRKVHIDPQSRAEQISLEQFAMLTNVLL